MQEALQSVDLAAFWGEILRLARDPYSNITAALLLLAGVVIFVVMFASIIIAVVTGRPKHRDDSELNELRHLMALLEAEETGEAPVFPEYEPEVRVRYPWPMVLAVSALGVVIVGIALGATTANPAVCSGCHTATVHSKAVRAGTADPHEGTWCVQCHESSGWAGAVTIEVPGRILHYVNGIKKNPGPAHYGLVMGATCSGCHESVSDKTTTDEDRGVRMAHKQPVEAGARCTDCHTAATGVVSTVTNGMTPCLRCHDGKKASSECSYCHTKDVAVATRVVHDMPGRELIDTPDCGACHDMAKSCDPCHGGVRMPHTDLFMSWGHAREGVKDIWENDGKGCSTCHTASRRPCTKCHAFFPGHPTAEWKATHKTASPASCDSCHNQRAYMAGREFCGLCHTKPYVTQ